MVGHTILLLIAQLTYQ